MPARCSCKRGFIFCRCCRCCCPFSLLALKGKEGKGWVGNKDAERERRFYFILFLGWSLITYTYKINLFQRRNHLGKERKGGVGGLKALNEPFLYHT